MSGNVLTCGVAIAALSAVMADVPVVKDAINGAFAPDGHSIAFQRHNGNDFDIGIIDCTDGKTVWVERGSAESAYPTWSADGALAYVSHSERETAYQARKNKSQEGFNVYVWRNGRAKRITHGREFDFSPAFSRDGRFVYFCSGRGCRASTSNLWKVDVEGTSPPVKVRQIFFPTSGSYGISQPSESPCGKYLLWTESFWPWDSLAITVCDKEQRKTALRLTGQKEPSYASCWHPDGEYIAYTGYRDGDPGWGLYMMHVRSGAAKRLCDGRNPDFSPDGKRLLYDDSHDIFVRTLTETDFPPPQTVAEASDESSQPENVVFRLENPRTGTRHALPLDLKLGSEETLFLRADIVLDGKFGAVDTIFNGRDGLSGNALILYLKEGVPWFATRDRERKFAGVPAYWPVESGGKMRLTGIRAGGQLYISVDDAPAIPRDSVKFNDLQGVMKGFMPLDKPVSYIVGNETNATPFVVRDIEIGRGWPKNVPPMASLRRMFGDSQ